VSRDPARENALSTRCFESTVNFQKCLRNLWILSDFSEYRARLPFLRLHSRLRPRKSKKRGLPHATSHSRLPSRRQISRHDKFRPRSRQDDLANGGTSWFRDSRLTRFSPSSRISLPRSRRSPRVETRSTHSLPFALLGHAATAPRHSKPRRSVHARLFLSSHAGLRTRRSVKRSISFGDHSSRSNAPILNRFLSAIPEAAPLPRRARFTFSVSMVNSMLNFLPRSYFL